MSTETKFAEALLTQTFPHRNIRNVLSLHAKVSPEKTFLIHYALDNRREELAFAEVNARAHQTANLLQEDFSVKPVDRIAVLVNNPAETAIFDLACWILGAVVVPLNPTDDDATLASKLRESHVSICLAGHDYLDRAQKAAPTGCQLIQVGGIAQDHIPFFNELVKNMPNTFFNDHAEPTLDSPALWMADHDALTQGNLLSAAQSIAFAQAFTGNQRMMSLLPLNSPEAIILALMMPLLVGGSVVFNPNFSPNTFWRLITTERVQIASVSSHMLQACIDFADTQIKRVEPIWGSGVHQQDLTRFRHLICIDPTLDSSLVKTFQERLGLLVYSLAF